MREMSGYPDGFLWGVATSAVQIEGAQGRAPSVWDTFAARRGSIADGSTPATACDSLHQLTNDRATGDLDLLERLGATTYRFSISWPRVENTGFDYYDRLVDGLLERGIAPMATLFHWDTPQHLEDAGGWANPDTAHRFAEYAAQAAVHLGDRVPRWITLNEPREVTMLGHALGIHAPGHQLGFDALPIAHELLRAHGLALRALRAETTGQVGVTLSHAPVHAASDSPEDQEAAGFFDLINNWLFADPILTGAYPADLAGLMPETDLDLIGAPLDFYGLNYYNPMRVAAPGNGSSSVDGVDVAVDGVEMPFSFVPFDGPEHEGLEHTDFGWPIIPGGLTGQLQILRTRYGTGLPPVIITENGASFTEPSGTFDDQRRIAYVDSHLAALRAAIADGADVRGYCHWSLMDNWEWAEGFGQRFGLVHVDHATGVRTPRASFDWYADHIRTAQRAQEKTRA